MQKLMLTLYSDAMRVYQHSDTLGIFLKGHHLGVELLEPPPEGVSIHAIVVSNFPSRVKTKAQKKELLKLYFENERRSHGGALTAVNSSEDGESVVVCFQEAKGKNYFTVQLFINQFY
jgi:hypothetical protein